MIDLIVFDLLFYHPLLDQTIDQVLMARYDPPERKDQVKARLATAWAADIWGLGCLVWEVGLWLLNGYIDIEHSQVYNGCLTSMDQLGRLGDIPAPLQPAYKVAALILTT